MVTRPTSDKNRCIQHSLETIQPSLDSSAVEFDQSMSTEDSTRTTSDSNTSSTLLASQPLLSNSSETGSSTTNITSSVGNTMHVTSDTLAFSETIPNFKAIRVEFINSKFSKNLNSNARSTLTRPLLNESATSRSYKIAQMAFIEWYFQQYKSTLSSEIDLIQQIQNFDVNHLINFLADMKSQKHLQASTIKLWKTATTRLHQQPDLFLQNHTLRLYLNNITTVEPPVLIHKPTINLTNTFQKLMKVSSTTGTGLSMLQPKVAFLLGMAAFLRPSDLTRISVSSIRISSKSVATFHVVSPKEKRKGRRIIKPFVIHPHRNSNLCPVKALVALKNHQIASTRRPTDSLFVSSINPSKPIKTTTISSWIRRLLQLSTTETRVSVRSIASSITRRRGISLDDIKTMGNWSSIEVFEQHYRRDHMLTVDFTNTILDQNMETFPLDFDNGEDLNSDSEFEDAQEDFPN